MYCHSKLLTRGIRILAVAVSVGLLLIGLMLGCGTRFHVGDEVGVPPLPPSDAIIGLFEKVESADLTGNVYRLNDLPADGVSEVTGVDYKGRYRLFFWYNDGVNTPALRMATLQAASPYIETGADGIADSGLGGDDVQETSVGTDTGTSTDTVVVGPGPDSELETKAAGDDVVVVAIVPGDPDYPNPGDPAQLEVTCDSADVTVIDGLGNPKYCLPGADGVLDSGVGPSTSGTNDKIGKVIVPGPDGIADSGLGHNGAGDSDIQGAAVSVQADDVYDSTIGIPVGNGEPNRKAVEFRNEKSPNTPCVYDDNTYVNPTTTGPRIVHVERTDGIYTGLDGVAQSGLGGDDIQVVRAGNAVAAGGVIVRGGNNRIVETRALGIDDVYTNNCGGPCGPGATAGSSDTVVAEAGPNGVLETCPLGDDYVDPGDRTKILAGDNKRADTIIRDADDEKAIIDGGNGVAESGLWGVDVQLVSAGKSANYVPLPAVELVDDGDPNTPNTPMVGDDVEMVYDLGYGNADIQTAVAGDDVRLVPVGQPTMAPGYPVPILLPGPNNVIDTPLPQPGDPDYDPNEVKVIAEYGNDLNFFLKNIVCVAYYGGVGTCPPEIVNYSVNTFPGNTHFKYNWPNGIVETGLAGGGTLDIPFNLCGGNYCGDDVQVIRGGDSVATDSPIIDPGPDGLLATRISGDDSEAIIDGGNGVADSGLGSGDKQVIPAGEGEPDTVAVIASRNRDTGVIRELNTKPAGDDKVVDPGKGNLAGNLGFEPDNENTETDPDEDNRIENYAAVDDGEYFSWETTNIDSSLLNPDNPVNVPRDLGITNSDYTFQILNDPAGGGGLVAYISDGYSIWRLTSTDGLTWTTSELMLSPGGNGSADDPVVIAGVDGICNTPASGDDVQVVPVGQGRPDSIAIFAGDDGILQSEIPAGSDDRQDGLFIRTGPDGIRQTILGGDDWEIIPLNKGQPDAACVAAGANGLRDTPDTAIGAASVSLDADDRPPFIDLDGNSSDFAGGHQLPEGNELNVDVGEGESSGFDAFAVTHPFVYRYEGTWYMFYTGWGALSEQEAKRPDETTEERVGPCMRPGLDGESDEVNLTSVVNTDNTPGVVVAPRIGLAVSSDGITWHKQKRPIIGLGRTCSAIVDLSTLTGAIGAGEMAYWGNSDFDYFGAMGARVRADNDAAGEPVFSAVYGGLNYQRGGMESLPKSGSKFIEPYDGMKTSLGLARSFDIRSGWEKIKDVNPVFGGGGFLSSDVIGESAPEVFESGGGYQAFYAERDYGSNLNNSADDSFYISFARRYGTVYSICSTIARIMPAGTSSRALIGLLLILLPAIVLLTRKTWLKVLRKR